MNIHLSMSILTKIFFQFVVWVRWVYAQNTLKNSQTSSFYVRLDLSCWCLFHQLAFHQSLWVEASRFPEACVSERPTFLISWFSMMPLHGLFPFVQDQKRPFELVEDHRATLGWNWVKVPRLRITLGFPKHANKRRSSVRPCIPECYFWSFRGLSCLCEQFSFPSSLTTFTTHSTGRDWFVLVAQTLSAKIRFCVADK